MDGVRAAEAAAEAGSKAQSTATQEPGGETARLLFFGSAKQFHSAARAIPRRGLGDTGRSAKQARRSQKNQGDARPNEHPDVYLLFRQRRIPPMAAGILLSGRLTPMSASMYIVVEGEDPGFDIFVNGHALARNEDALEKLAVRLGVKPLLEFFSADENSMALLLEEGAGDPEWARTLPPPQWFTPEDGLTAICALHDFLRESPMALGADTAAVVSELAEYERVLRKTALRRLRWQLAVSWK